MPEKFVYANLYFEGCIAKFAKQWLVLLTDERDRLIGRFGAQDIPQRDVLESKGLPNVVVIWNIYPGRNATAGKAQHFQGCEIRAQELILFEVFAPWQFGNHASSRFDELAKCSRALQIDHGNKAFPLASYTMRVAICLNKAQIRLHHWAFVFNPVSLTLFERLYGAGAERLGVLFKHFLLNVVSCFLLSLFDLNCNLSHLVQVITIDKLQLLSRQLASQIKGIDITKISITGRRIRNPGGDERLEISATCLP